jgi:uncharacterized damage-inducible protein DinB
MKEILLQFATFNAWANQRLCASVLLLPELQQEQHIDSSFPSLKKTLAHLWDAESMWWQRMKLVEKPVRPSEAGTFSTEEVIKNLHHQDKQWIEWTSNATPAAIDHVFAYQNTKKELFKQPIYQMILHLFNHSTYHRGQLVTMLRQLGVIKIPSTDFIEWSRRR